MAKRQKLVFKNYDECAHIWAAQSQDEGSAQGRRMFFQGKDIYSYGYHFKIAHRLDKNTILFTNKSYSPTTGTHKWAVKSAVKHLDVFTIPFIDSPNHEDNYRYLLNEVVDAIDALLSSRNLNKYGIDVVRENIEEYNRFTARFGAFKGYPKLLKLDNDTESILIDLIKASETRQAELKAIKESRTSEEQAKLDLKREAQKARKEAIEALKIQEKRWAWLRGEGDNFPGYGDKTYLRIKNDCVQTSRHAAVPLNEALAMFRALESNVKVLKGTKIGVFEFTKADSDNIQIGCHTISRDEARRVLMPLLKQGVDA